MAEILLRSIFIIQNGPPQPVGNNKSGAKLDEISSYEEVKVKK